MAALVAAGLLTAQSASAAANPTPVAGQRRSATRLDFGVSGTSSLSVDVGSGNALFSDQLLTLPGVGNDVPIALVYNSSVWGSSVPSAVTGDTGSGWSITGFDQRLVTNADASVTYYGPGGLTGVFTSSSGVYTAPAQFQADLVAVSGGGWTLTDHKSQNKLTFNSSGRLTSSADRNGNTTTFTYDPAYGLPTSIVSSRGSTAARKVTITTASGRISTLTQTTAAGTRTVTLAYTAGGHLASVKDTAAGTTSFSSNAEGTTGSDTGQVKQVTSPLGKSTWLAFASSSVGAKTASVSQINPAADGGAGESVTRLSYPSTTQTLVADPTTDQAVAVSTAPHTTYQLDGSQRVSSVTDPNGNSRSRTYTTLGQIKTSTPAAGGATTFTYGANGGESLTSVATAGGATSTASYGNTGANAYLPSSSTDDAGNALSYTYNGAGNSLTSAQATGPQAKVAYNTYGQATSSTSPGGTVSTTYAYDATTHDLTTMTPPSGNSLGARAYTWDDFGRLATATDGRGNTTTYSYDGLDRITKVHYSAGATDVSYVYDANGRVTSRTDGSGTTTSTYDDLGHLTSVANTAGGGTQTYTYDLAGALATAVTGAGTTSYGYDAAHQLTSMTYPQTGATTTTKTTLFANDANGRRTDTWLQSSADHSTWAAHSHTDYDTSGRVTHVLGETGPATAPVSVVDQTACYVAGATAPSCSSTTSTDRSKIQWVKDNLTSEVTAYTYDDHARLTKAAITGGTNPRTFTYGYDTAGNRTTSAVTGTTPASQTLTYNTANQITSTGYSYDGAGNQTATPNYTTKTFNTAGQQTQAVVGSGTTAATANYTYAGTNQNELLSEAVTGGTSPGTYTYTYGRTDSNGAPEIESVGYSGSTSTGYVFHDPTGTPVMLQTNNTVTTMYMYDITGNPTAVTTSAATVSYVRRFDPYGASVRTDGGGTNGATTLNPYLFHQGVQDRTTGLIKFGGRWYDPNLGSWTQQDTLNAPLDPANANRYEYAGDDPINNLDSSGRFSFSLTKFRTQVRDYAVAGAIIGCAADVETGCAPGASVGFVAGIIAGGTVGLLDQLD